MPFLALSKKSMKLGPRLSGHYRLSWTGRTTGHQSLLLDTSSCLRTRRLALFAPNRQRAHNSRGPGAIIVLWGATRDNSFSVWGDREWCWRSEILIHGPLALLEHTLHHSWNLRKSQNHHAQNLWLLFVMHLSSF